MMPGGRMGGAEEERNGVKVTGLVGDWVGRWVGELISENVGRVGYYRVSQGRGEYNKTY